MAKKSSAKKNFFASLTALAVSATMMVGSTFAWFTDEVKSGRNKIVAGNLDVELSYYTNGDWDSVQEKTDLFGSEYWEPGHTEVVYLKVENEGSLDVKYLFTLDKLDETPGTNVNDVEFALSDYLKFGYVENVNGETNPFDSDAVAIEAVGQNAYVLSEAFAEGNHLLQGSLVSGDDTTFAVVVWMPETVGNVANAKKGTDPAEIGLGVTLFATQTATSAPLPVFAKQTVTFVADDEIDVRDVNGTKVATMIIDKDSLADGVTELVITIDETNAEKPNGITVEDDQTSRTFNIDVEGLKDGNTTPVKVELFVGTGLGDNVTVYHEENEIDATYNQNTGYVIFNTVNFSPFTFVYDKEPALTPNETPDVTPDEGELPKDLPKANVVNSPDYENKDLAWGSYGAWSPTAGLDSQLEAAYTFSVQESLEEAKQNPYANWYCDFYVKLDRALGANQIFLGGNYGSFGWVGFHNGDLTLDANSEIPLLGSVTQNPWTYEAVVQNVGTFICGVGDVDDALAGATFTVMLRLTNPEDTTEYYNVATINYTFTKTPVVAE